MATLALQPESWEALLVLATMYGHQKSYAKGVLTCNEASLSTQASLTKGSMR